MKTEPEPIEPPQVKKRAIDCTPYFHGLWCSIMNGKPFVNPITSRRWSEDETHIVWMLDSFNFKFCLPDELIEVVELSPHLESNYYTREKEAAERAEFLKRRADSAEILRMMAL